jgi:hypothetical protein
MYTNFALSVAAVLSLNGVVSLAAPAQSRLVNSAKSSGMTYRYWPVCLYVQVGAGRMKDIAENLVREANACGVDLKLSLAYVTDVPGDIEGVRFASKMQCKLANLRTNPPHPHATVITVVSPDSSLPAIQCNNPSKQDQDGCAERTVPPDGSEKANLQQTGNYDDNAMVSEGFETFATVRGGSNAAGAAVKWGLGVAMAGLVPGDTLGRGLGRPAESANSGAGGDVGAPLKEEACEYIRKAAYVRPNVRQPDRSQFTIHKDDPSNPMSLLTGKRSGSSPALAQSAASRNTGESVGKTNAPGEVPPENQLATNKAESRTPSPRRTENLRVNLPPPAPGNSGDRFEKGGGGHPLGTAENPDLGEPPVSQKRADEPDPSKTKNGVSPMGQALSGVASDKSSATTAGAEGTGANGGGAVGNSIPLVNKAKEGTESSMDSGFFDGKKKAPKEEESGRSRRRSSDVYQQKE